MESQEARGGEALELRYNKNHDAKGRFASGAGGAPGGAGRDGGPDSANDNYAKPTGFSENQNGEKTLNETERKRYDKAIIGKETSDGITVTGLSGHTYDRAAQRYLSPGQILDTLKSKSKDSTSDPTCKNYDGQGYRVVLNAQTGNMVTIMRRRKAK